MTVAEERNQNHLDPPSEKWPQGLNQLFHLKYFQNLHAQPKNLLQTTITLFLMVLSEKHTKVEIFYR